MQEMLKSQDEDEMGSGAGGGGLDGAGHSGRSSSSTSSGESSKKSKKLESDLYESGSTYEDVLEMAHDLGKGDFDHDHKVVGEFIKVGQNNDFF